MWNKRERKFYCINSIVVLIASLFVLYGLKGSIQERILILQGFSILAAKLMIKTILFLSFGFVFVVFLLKLVDVKEIEKSDSKFIFLIVGWIFYFFSISLLVLKKWAVDRFPIDQPEIVYFTLLNIRGGEIDKSIFFEGAINLLICFLISASFFIIASFIQNKNKIFFLSTKIIKQISINFLYFIFGSIVLLFSLCDLYKDLHINEYVSVIKKYSAPTVDSEFYLAEYIMPIYENIVFPEAKKNLIIILMESMESSFSDKESDGLMNKNLIPNLTKLAEENINFSNTEKLGGGTDLSGTGWTIAAMLSKFGGIPFNLMGDGNTNKRPSFMPDAITLNDVLDKNGYRQVFIFGSDKHFASRDVLLETHGNVEVHDIAWYKAHNMLPKDYSVFWGFEDKKLYEFAKYELNNLEKESQPFMFGLLTIDTHMPTGYQCEDCPDTEDTPLKNSILCADNQVAEFLEWCKEQSWYDDTVIVIMGDHRFMDTENTSPFDDKNGIRYWLDIFINAFPKKESFVPQNRKFSSFDMYPTILAALGCKINGEKLGFGVNLFSDEKTLCERFSEEYINSEIMVRNKQYESMEF